MNGYGIKTLGESVSQVDVRPGGIYYGQGGFSSMSQLGMALLAP